MNEIELCHWLLLEPSGKCRSIFAPGGDACEGYSRIGQKVSSTQFVLPMVFAVKDVPSRVMIIPDQFTLQFTLFRDDRNQPGPAFPGVAQLKVATLISELSCAIVDWISNVGGRFIALELLCNENSSLKLTYEPCVSEEYKMMRSVELTKAGLEMMAYARGLRVEFGV